MDTPASEASRIFQILIGGRAAAKYSAIRAITAEPRTLDVALLRMQILAALRREFVPPPAKMAEDKDAADTRCWLLSALGRIAHGDKDSEAIVRAHLAVETEPYDFARYWAMEGLVAGRAPDIEAQARRIAKDRSPLVESLAISILAAEGDATALRHVQERVASEDHHELWAMLRGLRVLAVPDVVVVRRLCEIVDRGEYTDATFDAVVALGQLSPGTQLAESAAQSLVNYLTTHRWPMYDSMRTRSLTALARLRVERTGSVLVEELSDDSASVVCEAARAVEAVLGNRVAVARVLEAAAKAGPASLPRYANALRWMDRRLVAAELETAMLNGPDVQQETARGLLAETGGVEAFQRLRLRTNAIEQYMKVQEDADTRIRQLFEASLADAQTGFRWAMAMDVTVFVVGVLLILVSAWMVLASGQDLDGWAGLRAGMTAGTGVLGVLYGILVAKPRQQVRESVDHLMYLKVIFLGYLRQLHQTDQAFTRRLIENEPMKPEDAVAFENMVSTTLGEAVEHLAAFGHAGSPSAGRNGAGPRPSPPVAGAKGLELQDRG